MATKKANPKAEKAPDTRVHLVSSVDHDKYPVPTFDPTVGFKRDMWFGTPSCRVKEAPWDRMTRDPTMTTCPGCQKSKDWQNAMEGRRDLSRGVDA